jgi:hypothetical protein
LKLGSAHTNSYPYDLFPLNGSKAVEVIFLRIFRRAHDVSGLTDGAGFPMALPLAKPTRVRHFCAEPAQDDAGQQ